MDFKRRFQPEIRFHHGDLLDTTCFRSGAAGTKDEAKSPRDDKATALRQIEEYEPTHLSWGNHDWRLHDLMTHPKAIVATLAGDMWRELNEALDKTHTKTTPYKIRHNWHYLGGVAWGHGFMYNQQAVRDHAEMLGCPVVIGHLHTPQMVEGRTIADTPSFCVGALADDELLEYGERRRNSLTHGHGIVYGEVSEDEAHLQLIRTENGKPFHFPVGI